MFSSSADILFNVGQGKSVADFMLKAGNFYFNFLFRQANATLFNKKIKYREEQVSQIFWSKVFFRRQREANSSRISFGRQTDRQTNRQTRQPIEALSQSLKKVFIVFIERLCL